MPLTQRAQGLVEYAMILMLVGIVLILVLFTMGGQLKAMFSNVSASGAFK